MASSTCRCCASKPKTRYGVSKEEDIVPRRGHWGNAFESLLTLVGYTIGSGTIWRLPPLILKHGGCIFIIPYVVFVVILAMPMMFMELAVGQYSGRSVLVMGNLCPLLRGAGISICILSLMRLVCTAMIPAWSFRYFAISMSTKIFPWTSCANQWNTPDCIDQFQQYNITNFTSDPMPAAQEYFRNRVLEMSDGLSDLGDILPVSAVSLLGCWVILFFGCIVGIKSIGKVVYVTVTVPYIILVALLVRGLSLPGSSGAMRYFLYPDFSRLLTFHAWNDACVEAFLAVGPAWGVYLTLGSYNRFRTCACYRDFILCPIINVVTGFFSSLVVFILIGYLAHVKGIAFSSLFVRKDLNLEFFVIPSALAEMPQPNTWLSIFFLAVILLRFNYMFALFEVVASGFVDVLNVKKRLLKVLVAVVLAVMGQLSGLIFTTQGGIYLKEIFDSATTLTVKILAIFELVVIIFCYGLTRFYDDISLMIGSRLTILWKILWYGVTPAALLFQLITTFVFEGTTWPVLGLAAFTLAPTLLCLIIALIRSGRKSLNPSEKWGPSVCLRNTDEHRLYPIAPSSYGYSRDNYVEKLTSL